MIWTDTGLLPGVPKLPNATQRKFVSGIFDNFGEESTMRQTFNDMVVDEDSFVLQFEARINIITAGDYEFDLSADD